MTQPPPPLWHFSFLESVKQPDLERVAHRRHIVLESCPTIRRILSDNIATGRISQGLVAGESNTEKYFQTGNFLGMLSRQTTKLYITSPCLTPVQSTCIILDTHVNTILMQTQNAAQFIRETVSSSPFCCTDLSCKHTRSNFTATILILWCY